MRQPQADGVAYRKHLQVAAKRGLESAIKKLEGPDVPYALLYLWEYFAELDMARGEGFNGAAPLTYATIDAWSRLLDHKVQPHEVQALLSLDLAFRHPEAFQDGN